MMQTLARCFLYSSRRAEKGKTFKSSGSFSRYLSLTNGALSNLSLRSSSVKSPLAHSVLVSLKNSATLCALYVTIVVRVGRCCGMLASRNDYGKVSVRNVYVAVNTLSGGECEYYVYGTAVKVSIVGLKVNDVCKAYTCARAVGVKTCKKCKNVASVGVYTSKIGLDSSPIYENVSVSVNDLECRAVGYRTVKIACPTLYAY